MSDEEIPSAETPAKPVTQVRRISNPRPRKNSRQAEKAKDKAIEQEEQPTSDAPQEEASVDKVDTPVAESPAPESPASSEATSTAGGDEEWEDAETAGGQPATSGNDPKRKRRRRKGKGPQNNPGSEEEPSAGPSAPAGAEVAKTTEPGAPAPQRPVHPQRPQIDPEQLAKKAWKIFLAEVSEEGVALINDQDARELSRRCFRLAEIFLDERGRRR